MAELLIQTPEDLKKLEGWTIGPVDITQMPALVFKATHPAAARPIIVRISPHENWAFEPWRTTFTRDLRVEVYDTPA